MNCYLVLCTVVCFYYTVLAAPVAENQHATDIGNLEIFAIPRPLDYNDLLTIIGRTSPERKKITIKLLKGDKMGQPDSANAPCQMNLYFKHEGSETNTVIINSIIDGKPTQELDDDLEPSYIFTGSEFNVTFKSDKNKMKIEMFLKESPIGHVCEWTTDIKYIAVEGDVEKVTKLEQLFGG